MDKRDRARFAILALQSDKLSVKDYVQRTRDGGFPYAAFTGRHHDDVLDASDSGFLRWSSSSW